MKAAVALLVFYVVGFGVFWIMKVAGRPRACPKGHTDLYYHACRWKCRVCRRDA